MRYSRLVYSCGDVIGSITSILSLREVGLILASRASVGPPEPPEICVFEIKDDPRGRRYYSLYGTPFLLPRCCCQSVRFSRRAQERLPASQRARRKRRQYLHRLASR